MHKGVEKIIADVAAEQAAQAEETLPWHSTRIKRETILQACDYAGSIQSWKGEASMWELYEGFLTGYVEEREQSKLRLVEKADA